jgi:hypothetical protein
VEGAAEEEVPVLPHPQVGVVAEEARPRVEGHDQVWDRVHQGLAVQGSARWSDHSR